MADLEVLGSAGAARFSLDRRLVDLAQLVRASAAGFSSLFAERAIELC